VSISFREFSYHRGTVNKHTRWSKPTRSLPSRTPLTSGGLYLKSFAKLRVRKSATCEWYCERSLSDMRNTIRMLLICAHATLRMTSNKAPQASSQTACDVTRKAKRQNLFTFSESKLCPLIDCLT
jgi:phosphoketolase